MSHASARVHLDTDLGGDPDDACALAMLLGWPGVDIAGITTTIDPGGQRAACVSHCLTLAGRQGIPVVVVRFAREAAALWRRSLGFRGLPKKSEATPTSTDLSRCTATS